MGQLSWSPVPTCRLSHPAETRMHFDRWMHFARELYMKNALKIMLVGTQNMAADIMNKVVDKTTFFRHRKTIMGLAD